MGRVITSKQRFMPPLLPGDTAVITGKLGMLLHKDFRVLLAAVESLFLVRKAGKAGVSL